MDAGLSTLVDRKISMHSMRSAFQNEVRPGVYLSRALTSAVLIALGMAGLAGFKQGAFHLEFLAPMQGWFARDPAGSLYIETWATILVNALMLSFGFWGAWLVLIGLVKIPLSKRFVPTCFTLGGTFLVLSYVVAPLVQVLCQILVQHYPLLGA